MGKQIDSYAARNQISIFFAKIIIAGLSCLLWSPCQSNEITVDLSSGDQRQNERITLRGGSIEYPDNRALIELFEDYHLEMIKGIIDPVTTELRAYAKETNPDKSFLISGNIAGGTHDGRWLETIGSLDYLNNEIDVTSLKDGFGEYLLTKQMAEAVGVGIMVMPNARSNKAWNQEEDPELYGRGTALAYATGAHMHIPWCLYDGSHRGRFYGRPETHAKYFQLIADNPSYFDEYTGLAWNELTVPYDTEGLNDHSKLENSLEALFEKGVPTYIQFDSTGFEQERGYPANLVSVFESIDSRYQTNLSTPLAEVPSPTKGNVAYNRNFFPPVVRVTTKPSLTPAVFHVIERFNWRESRRPSFLISSDLIDPENIESVSYITVGQPEKTASIRRSKGGTRVEVSSKVHDWAIYRVKTKEPTSLPYLPQESYRSVVAESEIPVMRLVRFSEAWSRPDWVIDMLKDMPPDPIKEYGTTRITWSYDKRPSTLKYAHENGWKFHGTENISGVHMGEQKKVKRPGLRWKQTEDWEGLARNADGEVLLKRADFDPPTYSASFATTEHQNWFLERNKEWVNRGVDGVQWDDLSAPLNRVWIQGGDFGQASLEGFQEYLKKRNISGYEDLSIESLKQQLMGASANGRPVVYFPDGDRDQSGFLQVPYNQKTDSRGNLWLFSPSIDPEGNTINASVTFRLGEQAKTKAEFYLTDTSGSIYYTALQLVGNHFSNKPKGKSQPIDGIKVSNNVWQTLQLRFDLKNNSYQIKLNDTVSWSESVSFRKSTPKKLNSVRLGILLNPKNGSFDLKKITLAD